MLNWWSYNPVGPVNGGNQQTVCTTCLYIAIVLNWINKNISFFKMYFWYFSPTNRTKSKEVAQKQHILGIAVRFGVGESTEKITPDFSKLVKTKKHLANLIFFLRSQKGPKPNVNLPFSWGVDVMVSLLTMLVYSAARKGASSFQSLSEINVRQDLGKPGCLYISFSRLLCMKQYPSMCGCKNKLEADFKGGIFFSPHRSMGELLKSGEINEFSFPMSETSTASI